MPYSLDVEIEAVTFSPDGKYIAAGDEAYLVTVYDLEGNQVKVLHHDAAFDGITWSPDGKYVAGGSEKREIVLWNADTWRKELLDAGGGTVNSLEFTKDSKKLIAAGNKRTPGEDDKHGFVKSWDVANNWEVIFEIKAQEIKSVKSVRLSPDEKTFAISGTANQVKIFSYPEAKELAVIDNILDVSGTIEAIAYHTEGNFIFAGGHGEVMHVYKTGNLILKEISISDFTLTIFKGFYQSYRGQ